MNILIWFLFCVFAGLYITGPISDPDLWWHIVVGRWIMANKAVPYVDYWNMFAVSMPWRAYSWSNELLFAWVDSIWGLTGLLTLKCAIAILLALTFSWVLGKIAQDNFIGTLLGFYVTIATFNHFTLRPQSLTWIFFAILIYLAEEISRSGVTKGRLLGVFSVSVLWANSHLTALVGLGSVILWILKTGQGHKKVKKERGVNWDVLSKVSLVGFFALFVTPYLGAEMVTLFTKAGHPFHYSTIAEFQSAQINHYSTAFLVILAAILLAFLHKQPRAVSLAKLFLAALFTLAGLAVVKFIPLAIIVIAAIVASIWSVYKDEPQELGQLGVGFGKLKELFSTKLLGNGLAVLLIAGIIVQIVRIKDKPLSYEQTPKEALDYIIDHKLPGPILNLFGDGGYIMYRFSDRQGNPGMLVPIDGRTNVNSAEIMKKHMAALRGQIGWREYLDAVNPSTILWRTEGPLTSILLEDPKWCLVHRDGTKDKGHVVFARKGKAPCARSPGIA